MPHHPDHAAVKAELDRLTADFFRAVSFEEGATPLHENIYGRNRMAKQSLVLVTELLPADARLVHQATLGHGEGRHALMVCTGRRGCVLGDARAC